MPVSAAVDLARRCVCLINSLCAQTVQTTAGGLVRTVFLRAMHLLETRKSLFKVEDHIVYTISDFRTCALPPGPALGITVSLQFLVSEPSKIWQQLAKCCELNISTIPLPYPPGHQSRSGAEMRGLRAGAGLVTGSSTALAFILPVHHPKMMS